MLRRDVQAAMQQTPTTRCRRKAVGLLIVMIVLLSLQPAQGQGFLSRLFGKKPTDGSAAKGNAADQRQPMDQELRQLLIDANLTEAVSIFQKLKVLNVEQAAEVSLGDLELAQDRFGLSSDLAENMLKFVRTQKLRKVISEVSMGAYNFSLQDLTNLVKHGGADPNVQGDNGFTALMVFCSVGGKNCKEGVRILLNEGADASIETAKGWTAERIAERRNHTQCLKFLRHKVKKLEEIKARRANADKADL